jgi:hypothetical protein
MKFLQNFHIRYVIIFAFAFIIAERKKRSTRNTYLLIKSFYAPLKTHKNNHSRIKTYLSLHFIPLHFSSMNETEKLYCVSLISS